MSATAPGVTDQRRRGPQLLLMGLVAALIFVLVNFYLLNRNNEHERQYIALSTNLQVLSQQAAKSASEAATGNLDAFDELADARAEIGDTTDTLRNGDPAAGLPASHQVVNEPLTALEETWALINNNSGAILDRTDLVLDLSDAANNFASIVPQLQAKTDEAVRILTQTGAPTQQVFVASRQLVLADRMLRRVNEILQGGDIAVSASDNFSRDAAFFESVMGGLINGDQGRGIPAVRNTRALAALGEAMTQFNEYKPDIDAILAASTDLFEVRSAADEILLDSQDMFDQSKDLAAAYNKLSEARLFPSLTMGIAGALATLGLLIMFGWTQVSSERQRSKETHRTNERNQKAILRLLDEMSSLADGDLTVEASVTEEVTGAIADSVNFAVEQLRDLVTEINDTAQKVAASAHETQATTTQLAEASDHAATQVRTATATINAMSNSFDDVAKRSRESSEVAQRSVDIASQGAKMVRETISGMDTIRDQIQETSKRMKRLGESSQEIGDIVELINGIAEQTNILALNAAIQAASAGGAGRGFAVVADEVQRLAERATNATRRIEALVQTIQTDTSEAVNSMESTTTEVVQGAKLAEDAGGALSQIEEVSKDLSELIQSIAQEAQTQSKTATDVATMMNSIRDISVQTSEGTAETAKSVGNLANLVRDLSDSVADFKLPG